MQNESEEFGAETSGIMFLKDLTRLDCALFEPSVGILGQSWHVDVSLAGDLDEQGFVYDFSKLKSLVVHVLKSTLDHALIIPVGSQFVHYSETSGGEHWRLHAKTRMTMTDFFWEYKCPKGSVFPLRCVALRPSIIEQEFTRLVRHRLPASIHSITVKLREENLEPTQAFFRYTHGIPGHDGLCQRLLHGHRSRIEVYVGDERRPDLEHFVVRDLFGAHVHIATPEQITAGFKEIGRRGPADSSVTIQTTGSFGSYEATLPADWVFVVERETSIECITRQVAQVLRKHEKSRVPLRVVCFEGINKGAIAEA